MAVQWHLRQGHDKARRSPSRRENIPPSARGSVSGFRRISSLVNPGLTSPDVALAVHQLPSPPEPPRAPPASRPPGTCFRPPPAVRAQGVLPWAARPGGAVCPALRTSGASILPAGALADGV